MGVGRTVSWSLAKAVLAHCEMLGLPPAALARDCGLETAQLVDPDQRVPARRMRDLWRAALRATGDPALALRVAGRSHLAMYGLVGHLALISRDVNEALGHLCRFQRLLSDDGFWTVERSRSRLVLSFDMEVPPDADVWRQGVELSLANAVGALRFLTGRPLRPRAATFAYRDPGYRETYVEVFGCPVRFEAKVNTLEFDPEVAAMPVRTASPALAAAAQREAEAALGALEAGKPTEALVSRTLLTLLPGGEASLGSVARALGLSKRTLERRLRAEGTGFRSVLETMRLELAQAWLRDRTVGIEAIAFRLGYADLTGFNRSFRKLAGCSPGEFRRTRAGVPESASA